MKTYRITVNGNQYDVTVEEANGQAPAAQIIPQSIPPSIPQSAPAAAAPPKAEAPKPSGVAGSVDVKSPLPGSIFKILVKPGENVSKGQVILIIEAMKMENEILAPSDGTIASIEIAEGSSINTGDLLLTMNN